MRLEAIREHVNLVTDELLQLAKVEFEIVGCSSMRSCQWFQNWSGVLKMLQEST